MTHIHLFAALSLFLSASCHAEDNMKSTHSKKPLKMHVELGLVNWHRNFDVAMAQAKKDDKSLLILFQEVPGCQGCVDFGKDTLSHPLIVDAIEDSFTPLAIFNNRPGPGGHDQTILKRFNEPAWNFQVIRFIDQKGQDIIPRQERVWTVEALATRMIEALEKEKKPVPRYLTTLVPAQLKTAAFAMHCFWDGEAKLARLPGVHHTEAGWLEGREVVKLTYDPTMTPWEKLVAFAEKQSCATRIYAPDEITKSRTPAKFQTIVKVLDQKAYRIAQASDQKRHLKFSLLKSLDLNAVQKTKINALLSQRQEAEIWQWLSPSQAKALKMAMAKQ